MTVSVGDLAPDFELPSTTGSPLRLSSYRGRAPVVLLFFPLAWSPVCTQELCGVREDYARYQGQSVQVLGLSVDSPFALQRWVREEQFPFPLLSDFNRVAARHYGVIDPDLMGLRDVAKRSVFLIDTAGVVRHVEVCPSAGHQPDLDALQQAISALA